MTTFVRPSHPRRVLPALASLIVVAAAGSASAADDANPEQCFPVESSNATSVVCMIPSGDYGSSSFLGSFTTASGGRVDFYSDDGGEWWVEQHPDGSTSAGWNEDDGGHYGSAEKSAGAQKGQHAGKTRVLPTGTVKACPKRTFAQAKAAAATTGTFGVLKASTQLIDIARSRTAPAVQLSMGGTGYCSTTLVVTRNGQKISSTLLGKTTMPFQRMIGLPREAGAYKVEVVGMAGCAGARAHVGVLLTNGTPKISIK